MRKLLSPGGITLAQAGWGILVLLAFSSTAILTAPLLMPANYDWRIHSISESAAQGLEGAWLARLGFLLLGLAVLWLANVTANEWARAAHWMHLTFGVLMIATAAFSHKPFISDVPFDPVEDLLHSITATGMGFAFSFGVVARFAQRDGWWARILDLIALGAAVVIPLMMGFHPGLAGLAQRGMFLVAYAWYGAEAYRLITK